MSKINWDRDKRKQNVALRGSSNDKGDPISIAKEAWIALRKPRPPARKKESSARKKEVKSEYSAYPPDTRLQCPYCVNSVRAERMADHVNREHPPHKRLLACRYCNQAIAAKAMKKHIAKQHPLVKFNTTPQLGEPKMPELYPCPKCKIMVESIKAHLSEVHRIEVAADGSRID